MSFSAGVYLGDLESTCGLPEFNFPLPSLLQISRSNRVRKIPAHRLPHNPQVSPAYCPMNELKELQL